MKDIDWNQLWQEARQKRSWQGKSKKDWNNRAAGFARRNSRSPYIDAFLDKVCLQPKDTVLDVGSGPGTLSLPFAELAGKVTALDFSSEMIALLRKRCSEDGIENIEAIEASWEDDWHALGVERHDVVVASRSLAVTDLQAALEKLNAWATKKVIISDRIGNGPFDAAMFQAVGREFVPGPDYIYTLNILYEMGILARVDFISSGSRTVYHSKQAAIDAWIWMFDDITESEEEKFMIHMESRLTEKSAGQWTLQDQVIPRWALIQWNKNEVVRCE